MKQTLLIISAIACFLTAFTSEGYAIPAFARKYQTSCATCHVGFPKLNAFGEAFRRNGYQFPAGTDPEFIKETPVSLGSDGNKKAFPDAIWPGTIPGSSPISIFLNGEMEFTKGTDSTASQFSFGGLGNSIEVVAGGTLGEDLSFWGQAGFSSDGVELNRIFLTFSNIIGDKYEFNGKIGVFEPGLFSFSTHRAWMEGYWLTTRSLNGDESQDPANGMGWTLEETQKGIEFSGMFQGRFGYNVGVIEGFGLTHPQKDYYGHVTYKFEGLPLDGVTEGGPGMNKSQPYVDNSLTVGAFVYGGNASLGSSPTPQSNNFTMAGGDINAWYDRFNLFGGVGIRHDESPYLDPLSAGLSANTTVWFTELDVVAYPWLLPGLRYESWMSDAPDFAGATTSYTDQQFVPGVVFLVRPNVKFALRSVLAKPEGADKFDFTGVVIALNVGM
jgi:hypothetical protein